MNRLDPLPCNLNSWNPSVRIFRVWEKTNSTLSHITLWSIQVSWMDLFRFHSFLDRSHPRAASHSFHLAFFILSFCLAKVFLDSLLWYICWLVTQISTKISMDAIWLHQRMEVPLLCRFLWVVEQMWIPQTSIEILPSILHHQKDIWISLYLSIPFPTLLNTEKLSFQVDLHRATFDK